LIIARIEAKTVDHISNFIKSFKFAVSNYKMIDLFDFLIITFGGFAAGFVNAIAGGGTLISFPILLATGIPVVSANVTSTVSLSPGYFAAAIAQFKDLKEQKKIMIKLLPFAVIGGIIGGILLLYSGDNVFGIIVPYLILLASLLLAFQESIKKWLKKTEKVQNKANQISTFTLIAISGAGIYGGYFGAGLSVIVLAVLAISFNDNLTRLNSLKQAIGFAVNISTAVFFIFSGKVVWHAVVIMAIGAILGGWVGGKLGGFIKPLILRIVVVIVGITVSIIYFIK
jgi:uncharacterized membrane protein YfcA